VRPQARESSNRWLLTGGLAAHSMNGRNTEGAWVGRAGWAFADSAQDRHRAEWTAPEVHP